jgi:hypothetical protein
MVILNDYNKISSVEISCFLYKGDDGILTFSFMTYTLVKLSIYNPITVTFFIEYNKQQSTHTSNIIQFLEELPFRM